MLLCFTGAVRRYRDYGDKWSSSCAIREVNKTLLNPKVQNRLPTFCCRENCCFVFYGSRYQRSGIQLFLPVHDSQDGQGTSETESESAGPVSVFLLSVNVLLCIILYSYSDERSRISTVH